MKKIAVLASGEARSAERLITLFNEGNRIRVVAVVTDGDPAVLEERFRDFGVPVMGVTPETDPESLVELERRLEVCGAEYYAIDGYDGLLADRLRSRHGEKVVILTSPEEAPREVVAAFETVTRPAGDTPATPERPKTPDEEWGEALQIDFDEQRVKEAANRVAERGQTPPPVPGMPGESAQEPSRPDFASNPQYNPYNQGNAQFNGGGFNSGMPPKQNGYNPYQQGNGYPQGNSYQFGNRPVNNEPMPPTYLIWSVVITVLCCTIPGIVAIIYSAQVSSKYYAGDIEAARRCSRNAEIWIIVSFVLGVLSSTLYIPISLFT